MRYEFWPTWAFYWPIAPVLLWNALRARSLLYFTAVNPSIEGGGLFGSSKSDILAKIPRIYLPKTITIETQNALEIAALNAAEISFPCIAKPDKGERGIGVVLIKSFTELLDYHQNCPQKAYIVQEFVAYPVEVAVFYSRKPSEQNGVISSFTLKKFLTVCGDGKHTFGKLLTANFRANLHLQKWKTVFAEKWETIPEPGEEILIEPIGNHNRGTEFINANYLVNKDLEQVFDKISRQIEGFQYGRYDLKCTSLEDLFAGKNIKIMELNGTNAEPVHIYDLKTGIFGMYKSLIWHWTRMADIAIENRKNGIKAMPARAAWHLFLNRYN